jgi:hypothetical protein
MPSTYSPSLRIELIGDGEQSGTWGQTTNNNLGTLLEQAITGITNVNVTASDVVLTSFNGAVDEARSPVLNVSGTPGVTRNVTIPNQKKTYLVKNTSNATVGIKTASGGAATVSAGSQSLLVCNGSDVVTPYLESTVVTPPFVAGTIMLFVQTSAPTGWTKVTTYTDAALRVVNGAASSGGVTGFATIFAAGGVASNNVSLTTAQMPSHSHTLNPNFNVNFSRAAFDPGGLAFLTSEAGGPTFSIFNTGSSDTHYHTTTMNLKYVDVIIASKD